MKKQVLFVVALFIISGIFGKSANAHFNKGVEKYYKGAIEEYSESINKNHNVAKSYLSRGIAKYYMQDYEEAIADQKKAIEIDPKYADAYFNFGDCKYNTKCNYNIVQKLSEKI